MPGGSCRADRRAVPPGVAHRAGRRLREVDPAGPSVHAGVQAVPAAVRRRQRDPGRGDAQAGVQGPRHLHRAVPGDAARRHRRGVLRQGHRPRAGVVDLHAQRALHGGGRRRLRLRRRDPRGVRADAGDARAGARERRQGRHHRPLRHRRSARRDDLRRGPRAVAGHRREDGSHRRGARAGEYPQQVHGSAEPAVQPRRRRPHHRLHQGGRRRRRRRRAGGDVLRAHRRRHHAGAVVVPRQPAPGAAADGLLAGGCRLGARVAEDARLRAGPVRDHGAVPGAGGLDFARRAVREHLGRRGRRRPRWLRSVASDVSAAVRAGDHRTPHQRRRLRDDLPRPDRDHP